jgi:glycolate oxidase FAD binding subunit
VAWAAAQGAARAGGGSFVLEAGPAFAKRGHDVFGEPGEALPLVRALKARFDPRGVLNPGRFAGGV